MSALETLAEARQHSPEHAVVQHDAFLHGMQQAVTLLGLLQQVQQQPCRNGSSGKALSWRGKHHSHTNNHAKHNVVSQSWKQQQGQHGTYPMLQGTAALPQ